MMGTEIKLFGRVKRKYRPYIVGIIIILCISSTFFTYKAMSKPLVLEENVVKNTIEEKIAFDYAAQVQASTLYPEGGQVIPDGVMFTKLTDKLIIQLDSSINTEKPVKVQGDSEVTYSLVAKDMWERTFNLTDHQISSQGISNTLLQEQVEIDISKIFAFIEIIEEETIVRGTYSLVIRPQVTGSVLGEENNEIHEINKSLEIPFDISSQYIKYAGESIDKEFIEKKNIEEIKIIPQKLIFFGKELPIIKSRYAFGSISIITLLILIIGIFEFGMLKKKNRTEVNLIDKKYKNKIIDISDKTSFRNLPQLRLKNFKSLLQISENNEESILRYVDDTEEKAYYYIVSANTLYYYSIVKNTIDKGSELVS